MQTGDKEPVEELLRRINGNLQWLVFLGLVFLVLYAVGGSFSALVAILSAS